MRHRGLPMQGRALNAQWTDLQGRPHPSSATAASPSRNWLRARISEPSLSAHLRALTGGPACHDRILWPRAVERQIADSKRSRRANDPAAQRSGSPRFYLSLGAGEIIVLPDASHASVAGVWRQIAVCPVLNPASEASKLAPPLRPAVSEYVACLGWRRCPTRFLLASFLLA